MLSITSEKLKGTGNSSALSSTGKSPILDSSISKMGKKGSGKFINLLDKVKSFVLKPLNHHFANTSKMVINAEKSIS